MLNDAQVDRYSRQIILPEVGGRGQEKLLAATLAVVDTVDPQAIVPLYLAAAGIGRLHIWRPGTTWSREALDNLADLNPDCGIELWTQPATRASCAAFIATHDPTAVILIEEEAELATQLNAACVAAGRTLLWGRAAGAIGYLGVFDPRLHPGCRACAVSLGSEGDHDRELQALTIATLATQLAFEAIKLVLTGASPLAGKILRIDVATASVTTVPFASDPRCAVCSRP